jgi:SAM-dependent methyltransferase
VSALPALVHHARTAAIRARTALTSRRAVAQRSYEQSWRDPDVAAQMARLVGGQLDDPEAIDPLRVFLAVADELAADPRFAGAPIRFLEHGCGVGHYATLLERRHPGRFAYTGADYSEAMIETARRERDTGTFVVDDLLDSKLDLGAFDVVCASALIDVLPEWRRPLELLLAAPAPIVFLHRQRVATGASHVDVAPGYEGQRTYATYVARDDLERLAADHQRTISTELPVSGPVWSFVFQRAGAA